MLSSCLGASAPPELQLKSSINTTSAEKATWQGALRVKFMKLLHACTKMGAGEHGLIQKFESK